MSAHLKQFLKFCAVGGIGLLINLGITHAGVTLGLWYLYAFIIGLIISWSCSFVLNAFFTFPEHTHDSYGKKYSLFIASYALVFVLTIGIVYALTSIVGIHYLISICISAVITTLLTYSFSKYVVYR